MPQKVKGNSRGLAPPQLARVAKLYERRVDKGSIVSLDFARELSLVASDLRRRIGVLISREGRIEEVFLGTNEILYIPPLGRHRLGKGRLRGLRLLFSDISSGDVPVIPRDIYTDLEKLRFDMVVAVKAGENRVSISYSHLAPAAESKSRRTVTETVREISRLDFDFPSFIQQLEDELARRDSLRIPDGKTPALLVGVYGRGVKDPQSSIAEMEELARTAGISVVERVIQKRKPDPKTVLGKGKLEEVVLECLRLGAELLIFDAELKPYQWRIITNSTELKVIDRSMLILDIFAQRAMSSEGRLQVELAQLRYNLPRLVEKDAGLSRLAGGIGGRGPGETKLEVGRRRARDRINDLEKRIEKLSSQRRSRRKRRKQHELPLIAILGYTNVGKSTLFNALSQSEVLAENLLFATLDPAQRRVMLPTKAPTKFESMLPAIMTDTVGFIRELPNELMNAFRATLEELQDANLLVHVVDASDPAVDERKSSVEKILAELELLDIPQLVVLNKIDQVSEERVVELCSEFDAIPVSGLKKIGLNELMFRLGKRLKKKHSHLVRSRAQY